MTTPTERELVRILRDRAETITTTPQYRLDPDDELAPRRAGAKRRPTVGRHTVASNRAAWLSVAAVAVLGAGVAGSVWLARDNAKAPATARQCVAQGSGAFASALAPGALPPGQRVLFAASDGTRLIAFVRNGYTAEVDYQDPQAGTRVVWSAKPGQRVRVVANSSGAASNGHAIFTVVSASDPADAQVVAVSLATPSTVVLHSDPGYQFDADPGLAPIMLSGGATVIEVSETDPASYRIASFSPGAQVLRVGPPAPAKNAESLLAVGGNVVVTTRDASGRVATHFFGPEPGGLEREIRSGWLFGSDGTTLRWLTGGAGRYYLRSWAPGYPEARSRRLMATVPPARIVGGLVILPDSGNSGERILDPRTGALVALPQGMFLDNVVNGIAYLSQETPAGARAYAIPVRTLIGC